MTVAIDPGKSRPKKEKEGVLGYINCQILQCGTLNKKIRGWMNVCDLKYWFKNVILQFKIKYITSETLDFSRNTGADIILGNGLGW